MGTEQKINGEMHVPVLIQFRKVNLVKYSIVAK